MELNTENRPKFDKVTRVEVIDHRPDTKTLGRVYVNWNDDNKVELSLQDNGRTLKIFITKREQS